MPHLPPAIYAEISGAAQLDAYRWRNRVILLLGAPGDPAVQAQLAALADPGGLADRDLVILTSNDPALRRCMGVPAAGFAALLIGKDGGVKLRSAAPIPFKQLASTIDVMPMRRDEMRSRTP